MNDKEHISYWVDSAEIDFKAMLNLFDSKDYAWALFIGHLVIEKLLKGLIIKCDTLLLAKTHDLNKLASFAKLELSEEQKDILDEITLFNLETRYPDYKLEFYKKCTKEFTTASIEKILELRTWLKNQLQK
ncbi:MAG: HEPN domain-containing protein [Ignavibacteria bacterium]|nr:MAG: HEPN domain-containing protein [Ignavibacteria bacterium]KAF0161664.1 MAG: HEPN domain-containing protein [Ignavibacteria bacterium]